MTRSEKKKIAFERYKQNCMESSIRCIQSKLFIENCRQCEHCRIVPYFDYEKWFCNKKARKPMTVNENGGFFNHGLSYNDLNGKCDIFTFLVMLNED